jgi:fumarate reductase flavoprotein subunit
VLDQNNHPIMGLYAAGACTGGLEGGEAVGYVGGLGKSATTGFRAAEHIAANRAR